ncbi:MAG TPA: hypothetical protein VEC92_04035 [Nitrososphaerales archaeon]|nr:hypothetical protein [Nitrososphaerales archaeon]
MPVDFNRLIEEAEKRPFSGWDFSYIDGRYVEGKPSWDFAGEARRMVQRSRSMLDIGTGGGEFLSSLSPLPGTCCATEGYAPNSYVARDRLLPIGVDVVFTFCDDNGLVPQRGALPFKGGIFDFVMDRHESFVANEVERVLRRGGVFATQQVGDGNNPELHEFFGKTRASEKGKRPWNLAEAVDEIESAGMKIVQKREERMSSRFLDVGALVYYLKAIPWEIPDFDVRTYRERLLEMHKQILRTGSFGVTTTRFYVQARKE